MTAETFNPVIGFYTVADIFMLSDKCRLSVNQLISQSINHSSFL